MRKKVRNATSGEPVNEYLCSKVAVLRKKKRWTLARLSALSGVSRSMLSQIERNRANPTLAIAYRIAQAFGVSLDDMIEHPAEDSLIEKRAVNNAAYLFRSDYNCRIRMLSPKDLEKDVEFYEVVIFSNKTLDSAPHLEGTLEIVHIHQGSVRVTCGSDVMELTVGDSANYIADKAHSITNIGPTDAILSLADIYHRG